MDMTKQEIFAPILIVEDEEDHSRLIKNALSTIGMVNDIYQCENGQDAIDFLKREGKFENSNHIDPGLILLDVKMPMKNGFEVLREIKSDEKLKKIPVVMLTTTSTGEDIEKALKLGANDYIVKPVKFSDFTHKVSKLGYYWGLISSVKNLFI